MKVKSMLILKVKVQSSCNRKTNINIRKLVRKKFNLSSCYLIYQKKKSFIYSRIKDYNGKVGVALAISKAVLQKQYYKH